MSKIGRCNLAEGKSKVLVLCNNNENRYDIIQGAVLEHVMKEKDLRVIIDMGG